MFKNREIRVRLAKTTDANDDTVELAPAFAIDRDDIKLVADYAKKGAAFIGAVWIAGKIVDAGCAIAIHHGTKS